MDWETEERMPIIHNAYFHVIVNNEVRRVVRCPDWDALFFTDCTHPAQNVHCDSSKITAWKLDR